MHSRRASVLHVLFCLPWLVFLVWFAAEAWFLTDDAFISFRYVRNLIEGHGLVFNPGERVEGYTNFLWVLELAALGRRLDCGPSMPPRGCRWPIRWRRSWRCYGGSLELRDWSAGG